MVQVQQPGSDVKEIEEMKLLQQYNSGATGAEKQANARTQSNNFGAYPPLLMSLFLTWLPNGITQVKFEKIKFASFDNTLTFAN